MGSEVRIRNSEWGAEHAGGNSTCLVVGYVNELRFPDGGLAPACIMRVKKEGRDYAFRCFLVLYQIW